MVVYIFCQSWQRLFLIFTFERCFYKPIQALVQVNYVRSLPRIQNKPRRSGIEPIAFIIVSVFVALPALHNLFSESSAKQFKQQVQFILN